ncbi:DUF2510 domain-containing protein [Candidatus Poriferisocius sp.]|uniref:DUF2510 domain-containing protein n=1 Tax=Candidatus Poriferisocius sp. TaxID=3101276 RepID=UPI003B02CF2C
MVRLQSELAANPEPEASWHTDPFGRHEARWWNGTQWTEKVRDGDQSGIDPPGIAVAPRGIPLNEPASPIPGRRSIRLFGKHLPGAMLLASVALAAVIVLVIVVAVAI